MPSRAAIFGLLMLLALSLVGCGTEPPGGPGNGTPAKSTNSNSLGEAEFAAIACAGVSILLLVAIPISVLLLVRRSQKTTAPTPSADIQPVTGPNIFISYRRSESQDVTGRIYDAMAARFSKHCVFKDVDSLPLGKDFREVLQNAIRRANVVIVVIGPNWSQAKTADGQPRLNDPNDFVRIEIETALKEGIAVIPVMVSNAVMAPANDLPQSLQQLPFQNGMPVRPDPDFHRDMERLFAALEKMFPNAARPRIENDSQLSPPKAAKGRSIWIAGCAFAVIFVIFVSFIMLVVSAITFTMFSR
jgi:hypothetical protein